MMDTPFARADNLFMEFEKAVFQRDLDTATEILPHLKDLHGNLPPLSELSSESSFDQQQLTRDICEVEVILSVLIEDKDAFEREVSRLKWYCITERARDIPTGREYAILRLNLLRLLLQNRISDFHIELETLSEAVEEAAYGFMHPYELGPGEFDWVFTASEVANFVLSQSDRDRISGCNLEKYDWSSMSDDQKRVMIRSMENLAVYIKKHPEWEIKNGRLGFRRAEEESPKDCKMMRLINEALSYVRNLDIAKTCGKVKEDT